MCATPFKASKKCKGIRCILNVVGIGISVDVGVRVGIERMKIEEGQGTFKLFTVSLKCIMFVGREDYGNRPDCILHGILSALSVSQIGQTLRFVDV